MSGLSPRAVPPADAVGWLAVATGLVGHRPGLFVVAALLPPMGTVLLLALPIWRLTVPIPGPWIGLLATAICYGIPLGLGISVACAAARAADRDTEQPWRHLANRASTRPIVRTALYLFALLLQGYLALYIVQNLLAPVGLLAGDGARRFFDTAYFGVADTILATQLGMTGGLLLVTQVLFALFTVPLHLFREVPLYHAWRLSFRATWLNPWLPVALGVPALLVMLLSGSAALSAAAQVLALPLPAFLGAFFYVAWREIFADVDEAETLFSLRPTAH